MGLKSCGFRFSIFGSYFLFVLVFDFGREDRLFMLWLVFREVIE